MVIKTLEEQIAGWCKHYTGAYNSECRQGINYRALGDDSRPGYLNRLPCLRTHFKPDIIATCELQEWPTPEEIAADVAETERVVSEMITARVAINNYLQATGQPSQKVSGQITCPVCGGGELHFVIAYNGHCHAKCNTPHCVSWME